MGKYEIHHFNDNKQRMQYNTYHNCSSVEEAITKHENKGFNKDNIKKIIHHTKREIKGSNLTDIIGI